MTAAIAANANPTEVARETIRQLASRRIAPTPDNYARIYAEISGEGSAHPAVAALERVAAEMTRLAAATNAAPPAIGAAVKRQKWDEVTQGLLRLVGSAASAEALSWHALVRDLLRQWELRHDGLPAARKREALEQVLEASRGDPVKLYQRLGALVRTWGERPLARTASGVVQPIERGAGDSAIGVLLRDLLSQTLEYAVTDRLGYSPELAGESGRLAIMARESSESRDFNRLAQALRQFWLKLELRGESVDEIMRGLMTLVRLLTRNIGELSDDPWMREQLAHAEELLKEPLDPRALREAEKGFREVAFRQAMLKGSVDEAKSALKSMVGRLIDRLDELTVSTGGYHKRFGEYAGQIAAASDLSQISAVIANLLSDTRGAEDAMRRSRDELEDARRVAHAHEERVRTLERELSEIGARVKEDQLTSVLNRRGLEEAYAVEEARAARTGSPLSVALLDVDNFKHLNDRLGHLAGDGALKHLAGIMRDAVRPSDVIARYGGEEFVLLLPDTGTEEATQVMVRVQRALTRRFFLHQNERVLITFSAGVALWQAGEARDDVIARADRAMYEAKQAGKNRVCVAAPPLS